MPRNLTVDDILDELRSLADEDNIDQLRDKEDILPALNNAQERAYQILSRVYPEPILEYQEISGITGREYELPESIFMDKIKRIEFFTSSNTSASWCERVTLPVLSKYETSQTATSPACHALYARKIRFNAPLNGNSTMRIWYLRSIERLVKKIGRITNVGSTSFVITELNSDFEITTSDLTKYFNVIDGQTGLIKASFQIKSWNGVDEITIKSVPDRSSVLNRTISTSISSPSSTGQQTTYAIAVDDYIAPIEGTCVLPFFGAVHTYIVQQTTATIKRKLGYAYDADQTLSKDFEAELNKTHMGRSRVTKIKHGNSAWIQQSSRFMYSKRI